MDLLAPLIDAAKQQTHRDTGLEERDVIRLAEHIRSNATCPATAQRYLADAKHLLRISPDTVAPQICAAELIGRADETQNMLDTWSGIHRRFPDSAVAFYNRVKWLFHERRDNVAMGVLQAALSTIEDTGTSSPEMGAVFNRLVVEHDDNIRFRVLLGHWLFATGDLVAAAECFATISRDDLTPGEAALWDRLQDGIAALEATGLPLDTGWPGVLAAAIYHGAQDGPHTIGPKDDVLNGIMFSVPDIGKNEDSRSIIRLAATLWQYQRAGRNVHGTPIGGVVRLLTNTRKTAADADALTAEIELGAVETTYLSDPIDKTSIDRPIAAEHSALIALLPGQIRRQITNAIAAFRAHQPEVFCITDLANAPHHALAAIIAGVSRITLLIDRPGQIDLNNGPALLALSSLPNVGYACRCASDVPQLAALTGQDVDNISILLPSVFATSDATEQAQHDRWRMFDAASDPGCLTIGLFVDQTTLPGLAAWMQVMNQILARYPDTRFLCFGAAAPCRAMRAAISEHAVLHKFFVTGGLTMRAFWTGKCDLLIPCSAQTLHHTLIEAQMAGVPTIGMGPAAEDVIADGRSGYRVTSRHDILAALDRMLTGQPGLVAMAGRAREYASRRFDPERLAAQMVRFLDGSIVNSGPETNALPNVAPFREPNSKITFENSARSPYNLAADT